jgi:hypothetical protein
MERMLVTLEVSKLSGWLNTDARCRESKGGHAMLGGEVRAGRREGLVRWRHTQEACTGKARLKAWGPRALAERTWNMPLIVVTLEVSKLSGWLNADARCRVERRACDGGGGGE